VNRVLEDLRIVTQSEIFPMIKKLLPCRKLGVFIPPTLAVHLHFRPYIFILYQHFRNPRLVFSCLAIVEPFTSRKLPQIVIGMLPPPPLLRGSPRSSGRDPFLGPQIAHFRHQINSTHLLFPPNQLKLLPLFPKANQTNSFNPNLQNGFELLG